MDLDLLINSDQYDDLKTKVNAGITKINDIKEFLEPLTEGQVPVQSGTTDFNFVGKLVPFLKAGESTKEKKRIFSGSWNMDSTATLAVAHGLNSAQWKTMSIIAVMIRNDADSGYYLLNRVNEGGGLGGGVKAIDASDITLARNASGFFDDPLFNDTGFDRAFIDIEYIP